VTEVADHGAYIAAAPDGFRPVLEHVREVLSAALPDAEEMVALRPAARPQRPASHSRPANRCRTNC